MIGVKIDRFLDSAAWHFFIFESKEDGIYVLNLEKGVFDKVADHGYVASHDLKPTFTLPHFVAHQAAKAMVDTLTKQFGIGTETEAGLKGKLEATEGWLADMRRLVWPEK